MLQTLEPSVADVFITDQLSVRAPRKTDYLREKLALQDLAARMADQPEEILPRFVDLAMEMTGGISAGLSLYEEDPAPGVFRWTYLRGILAPFNGATTPRDFSPCGVTLDRNTPVLSAHPERVYTWIADADITVPEVLLVPLHLGGTDPLGTLWIVSDREGHFDSGHARVMTELAAFVGIALRVQRSEQHLQQALEEQATLAKEMSHRVKNVFAITEGLVRISGRDSKTKDELIEVFSGRLQALASAHALVRRSFIDVGRVPRASDIGALILAIVLPHEDATSDAGARVFVDGPSIQCGDHAINGIALIIHELTTNAAKYGALTANKGRIDVSWQLRDGELLLRWVERGGPTIENPPTASGFGGDLVRRTVARQFRGTLNYEWQHDGLVVTITLPSESLGS